MDDNMSIDTGFGDKNNTIHTSLTQMEWSEEHEHILVDWADKAMCYRWLHSQANNKFANLSRWFTIPVIIISTLTGTANFAQDRVSSDYIPVFVMIVGSLNIIAGIISTVSQFLKINELNESHRVSSIAWDKFYRNIKIELAKNPKERIPVGQMIKLAKEEFDRLMETSPVIQTDIINKFTKTFKDKDTFKAIKKPEICDDLVSTELYRFIPKRVTNNVSTGLKASLERAKKRKQQFDVLNKFYNDFNTAQGRFPTKNEILDSIQSTYKEFEEMKPSEIETHVEKFLQTNVEKKDSIIVS